MAWGGGLAIAWATVLPALVAAADPTPITSLAQLADSFAAAAQGLVRRAEAGGWPRLATLIGS